MNRKIQKRRKNNGYEREPKAYKVKKEYVEFLLEEIKKNKTITIEDLLYLLKNKYPEVDLNKSHINRIIHDNNITLKLTRIRHEPNKRFGKDIDINKGIKEFYDEVKKYKIEDIICIDETSIKSLQKRNISIYILKYITINYYYYLQLVVNLMNVYFFYKVYHYLLNYYFD
jgi:hypothetical protein